MEIRKKSAIINNYYVEEDTKDVFLSLLEAVTNEFLSTEKELEAVVQKPHESYFRTQGFEIVRAKRTNTDKRVLGAFVISNTIWGSDVNAKIPFYAWDVDGLETGVVDRAVTAYPLPFLSDTMHMHFID